MLKLIFLVLVIIVVYACYGIYQNLKHEEKADDALSEAKASTRALETKVDTMTEIQRHNALMDRIKKMREDVLK